MNQIENTAGKSCGHDLCPPENRQGLFADLGPSSPSPPRVAAVAHQLGPSSERHFSYLRQMDAAVPTTGLTQAYPPMGDSPGPARTIRQIGATLFDEAHEPQSGQATMASGGESAALFASLMNSLLSDDYAAYDPEDPSVRALMADYEATILDTGAAPPANPAREHSPVGDSPGPGWTADQRQAILHILETDPKRSDRSIADEFGVSLGTIQTSRKQFRKTGDIKTVDNANRLTADQRQALSHIFETDPERSSQSIADDFGVSARTIQTSRKQFGKTGGLKPGDNAKRLTSDQRRAILHIFETDSKRNNQSIAEEFYISSTTIKILRKRFRKTGNIKTGNNTKRLTADQRIAISHIFGTNPRRSNQDIADEFSVAYSTIQELRLQFGKTGNLNPRDSGNRLTGDQRRAILHIFKTDPQRNIQSIAEEFNVSLSTIKRLRSQYGKTGNLIPGDPANRLTDDQRRAILQIFETDPKRNNQPIAEEFDVSIKTIQRLRKNFSNI